MKLADLQTSLLDMTHEQKLAKIREIREDRQVSKFAVTHKARKKQDKGVKLIDKFNSLSPEDQEELKKLLGGGDEDKTG